MHTLGDIAALLGLSVDREAAGRPITGVAALADAGPTELSYLASDALVRSFRTTKAGVVLCKRSIRLPTHAETMVIAIDDAEAAFSKVLTLFAPPGQ